MKTELEQFKQETGYLPGQIELVLKYSNTAEFELYMLVDDVICKMQRDDAHSANEQQFINRFSTQVNTYFGS